MSKKYTGMMVIKIGLVCLVLVGQHYFTVGQRMRIRGRAQSLFVSGKDAQRNTVTGV